MKFVLFVFVLGTFAGCNAERPVVEPVEPEWSYHEDCVQPQSYLFWKNFEDQSVLFHKRVQTVEMR